LAIVAPSAMLAALGARLNITAMLDIMTVHLCSVVRMLR